MKADLSEEHAFPQRSSARDEFRASASGNRVVQDIFACEAELRDGDTNEPRSLPCHLTLAELALTLAQDGE